MYAAISPSDRLRTPHQRTDGSGRIRFKISPSGKTVLDELYQRGASKIRLPKTYTKHSKEAVLINSSGGLTGGDLLDWQISAGEDCYGVISSQACEKIYKSTGDTAVVKTTLSVAENARIDWLPQETILFDRAKLSRDLVVDLAKNARFLGVEASVLGRAAMGEQVRSLSFGDQWRLYREGVLVHADNIRLSGDMTVHVKNPAVLGGDRCFATLVYCGPEDLDQLKHLASEIRYSCTAQSFGVSAFNGKIVARLTAPDSLLLRRALIPILQILRPSEALPRVWTT
ncbi:urease accessory protein UreD [Sneathiella sp.]|jgi:urease accessory protein|uniref:urease accessory protein UreD n=1 Tax=Sneathiella sp. TaxID=1964365 RepID=UPI0039E53B29